MRDKILKNAKEDIPLYFNDFKKFWDVSLTKIADDELIDIYKATLVFKNWKSFFHLIKVKEFDLLVDELYEDVNSSLFLAFLGLYRSSHMHMRSTIELSLQLLYFWHHPIEYKKWQAGDFVIKHDQLAEYIVKHPNFSTDVKDLMAIITKNWKHYSKHIHGESPIFFQVVKDVKKTNSFSEADFGKWKTNYLNNVYYLNKLFMLFFKNDLNRMADSSRNVLMSFLTEDDLKLLV